MDGYISKADHSDLEVHTGIYVLHKIIRLSFVHLFTSLLTGDYSLKKEFALYREQILSEFAIYREQIFSFKVGSYPNDDISVQIFSCPFL